MKERTSWYSDRVEREVTVARWGAVGMPLLVFPTAGGDAEEIERFQVVRTLADYLEEGRIKIYSCDSVAGRAMFAEEGSPGHRMWLMNRFQEFVRHELVPAIRADCGSDELGVVAAGASIGAFQALAAVCRYPDAFTSALCMSGTFDLRRFLQAEPTGDFRVASPLHWLPDLEEGEHLERLRSRFVLLASGEGEAEDIGESWRVAEVLGSRGIPNRVDSWGTEWKHDWPTWRNMLHAYVPELFPDEAGEAAAHAGGG
ncbi:MAG TPA: alpha/beta hydrolase-fold protein [Longimicrobiales bacterium]|nr:alpha/beta hydrolase-fold protein [Longimicrobiales bacterium]